MEDKIFISYNRQDTAFALKLSKELIAMQLNIWMDQLNIGAGVRWDNEIQQALVASKYLVLILSPSSVASENVMDEVSYALENGKKVIPVMARECDVPFRLKRLQYINFTENYNNALERLRNELNAPHLVIYQPGDKPVRKNNLKMIAIAVFIVGLLGVYLFSRSGVQKTSLITVPNTADSELSKKKVAAIINDSVTPESNANENRDSANTSPAINDKINLLSTESGGALMMAAEDSWSYGNDGKENRSSVHIQPFEAVYSFKSEQKATFNLFTMLIDEKGDENPKDFELLYGNESPLGKFVSIGTFTTQNMKLFKTPYQEFSFPAITAKYFKVKYLTNYDGKNDWFYVREFQLWGHLQ